MLNKNSAESRFDTKMANLLSLAAKNFWPLAGLALVLLASFVVINIFKKPGQMSVLESQAMDMSAMVPPKGALPVAIARVNKESISGSVTYTGSAVAFEDEDINSRIEGRISQMPVYPGDRVRKGELLVQLDAPQNSEYQARVDEARFDAQASEHDASVAKQEFKKNEFQLKAAEAAEQAAQSAVAEAKANLDYWGPELQREADLLKKQVISQQEYDNEAAQQKAAEAKLARSQAELSQASNSKMAVQTDAEAMMHHIGHRFAMSKQAESREKSAQIIDSYRRIVSSADGVVTKRLVSPGVVVAPGILILKVAHINKIRLQAELANTDIDKIQVGTEVFFKSADNGAEHRAKVSSIFPAADPESRTFIVEALIDNLRASDPLPKGREGNLANLNYYMFLPGQYVVMRIITGQTSGLAIQSRAIVWKEGRAKVWKAVGSSSATQTKYSCLMHPEVIADKADDCPKCGMELQAQEKAGLLSVQLVDIKTGLSNSEKTEVLSGLAEGDKVIYEGQEDLQPGMKVVATEWGVNSPVKLPMASDIANDSRLSASNNWTVERSVGDISAKISMEPVALKANSNSMLLQLQKGGNAVAGATISGTTSMPAMMNMAGPQLHSSEKRAGKYLLNCDFTSGLWQANLEIKIAGQASRHLAIEIEVP